MEKDPELIKRSYSPQLLAYLGDAYYETLAREYVIGDGNCRISEINSEIKSIITAVAQSNIAFRILPFLTEEEMWFFKAGRNTHNSHRTKSAAAVEYRRATGLECLFGYLWLAGRGERAEELFAKAVAELSESGEEKDD